MVERVNHHPAAMDALARARETSLQMAPYYQRGIHALYPVLVKGLGTWGVTECGVLMADVDKLLEWDRVESATVLIHEADHVRREHIPRGRALGVYEAPNTTNRWGIAIDCEINDDVRTLPGARFPKNPRPLYPENYKLPAGHTAEAYYHALPDDPPAPFPRHMPGAGMPWDDPSVGALAADLDRLYGLSPAQHAQNRLIVASAVAAQEAKKKGSTPAGWARWAEIVKAPPQVRWSEEMRHVVGHTAMHRAGGSTPTFRRPNRRQSGLGYGPGVPIMWGRHTTTPSVWWATDTSGSMSTNELTAGFVELQGILRALNANVTFFSLDSAVHAAGQVRTAEQARALLKGGGGSDARPLFALAEAVYRGERTPGFKGLTPPDLVILFTDGMIDVPAAAPTRFPTMWVLSGSTLSPPAPWGKAIRIAL